MIMKFKLDYINLNKNKLILLAVNYTTNGVQLQIFQKDEFNNYQQKLSITLTKLPNNYPNTNDSSIDFDLDNSYHIKNIISFVI